jgi:hypothetical protein
MVQEGSLMWRALVRGALFATLILNGVLLLLPVLLLFGILNPMHGLFITRVAVENQTVEPIHVTPVGTVGSGNRRSLLPVYLVSFPAIWGLRNRDFAIPPGQAVDILYDRDDVLLSEIVVYDSQGRAHQLSAEHAATNEERHQPHRDRFVVARLDALADPSAEVLRVARSGFHNWRPWAVLLASLVVWPNFFSLRRTYRRACASPAAT